MGERPLVPLTVSTPSVFPPWASCFRSRSSWYLMVAAYSANQTKVNLCSQRRAGDCFKLYMSRIIAAASRAVEGTPLNQERRTLST